MDFISNGDGTCYVKKGTCLDTHILIPSVSPKGDIVTGISDSAFSGCTSITSITLPNNLINIGSYAFSGCNNLMSITIPENVISIDKNAFQYCFNLTSVYVTNLTAWCNIEFDNSYANPLSYANNMYINYMLAKDITIPEGLTSIGKYTFYNCVSLTDVTVPDSVTSIDEYAFYNCSSLTSVTLPDSVTSIGEYTFYNCKSLTSFNVPHGVTSIGKCAFYGCKSLVGITIPDSVTRIGSEAFYGCSSITSIMIPASVTSIDYKVFSGCGLTNVIISNGVTSIGRYAFSGCGNLTSITIPNSVTVVGDYAFSGCTNLIQTENKVSYVDKWVVDCETSVVTVTLRTDTVGISNFAFSDCNKLKSITIPNSLTSIGEGAFIRCIGLSYITIPNSVIRVGSNAFKGCIYLIKEEHSVCYVDKWVVDCNTSYAGVEIRAGTVGIADFAFSNVEQLRSITIPDSVKSVGCGAFTGCKYLIKKDNGISYVDKWVVSCDTSITDVVLQADIKGIGSYAFNNPSDLAIIYYCGSAISWGKIPIGFSNFYLTKATVYCYSDTQPTTVGNYWHYVDGVPTKW